MFMIGFIQPLGRVVVANPLSFSHNHPMRFLKWSVHPKQWYTRHLGKGIIELTRHQSKTLDLLHLYGVWIPKLVQPPKNVSVLFFASKQLMKNHIKRNHEGTIFQVVSYSKARRDYCWWTTSCTGDMLMISIQTDWQAEVSIKVYHTKSSCHLGATVWMRNCIFSCNPDMPWRPPNSQCISTKARKIWKNMRIYIYLHI